MRAFSNESFSHKGAPKGLYTLVLSRSDLTPDKVAKAHERNFHEGIFE